MQTGGLGSVISVPAGADPMKGARRLVARFLGEANTVCYSQPATAAARSRLKSPASSRPIQC